MMDRGVFSSLSSLLNERASVTAKSRPALVGGCGDARLDEAERGFGPVTDR